MCTFFQFDQSICPALFNTSRLYSCRISKQIIFSEIFLFFNSGGITKRVMTGPSGNSEFYFPSTSMFPLVSPRGTLRVTGKQNSLLPLWPVKYLVFEEHILA